MAGLDKAGQQMNKLLKRERGERLEEDQDSLSSSSEDDVKPGVATVRTDQHALQLRASMNDVSAPFSTILFLLFFFFILKDLQPIYSFEC